MTEGRRMEADMFTNILLATDGSECALRAASVAARLAHAFGACLTLISVFEPFPSIAPYAEAAVAGLDQERVAEQQEQAVSGAGRVADGLGVPYGSRRKVGHPADEIVRAGEEEGCDLIVIGGRGRSGVESFLLGSVADRVAHHARCPVLIVK